MRIHFSDIPKICLFFPIFLLLYRVYMEEGKKKKEFNNNDNTQDLINSRDESDFQENNLEDSAFTDMFLDYFNDEMELNEIKNEEIIHMSKLIDNYIHRYVNLFLKVSQLDVHKVEENEKLITASLEIVLTPEELSFLQNYSKTKKSSSALQRVLTKLDGILGNMVRVRDVSLLERGDYIMKKLLSNGLDGLGELVFTSFNSYIHPFLQNPYILIFLISFSVASFIFPFNSWRNVTYAIFMVFNIVILYESYQNYQGLIEKLEFESLTLEKPDYCDSSKRKWYHGIVQYFAGDSCYEYYKKMVRNPAKEVSLLQSIIDVYAFYAIEKPLHIFGKSMHLMANQFTRDLPWPIRWILQIFVTHTVLIISAFVILILCGMNLKFSFFGTSLQFGQRQSLRESTAPALSTVKAAEKALTS